MTSRDPIAGGRDTALGAETGGVRAVGEANGVGGGCRT